MVDHIKREADSSWLAGDRFRLYGGALAAALSSMGIDARVGAVPGEYCPGEHSVNARGTVKLIGTAQRAVRDAWLFSSLVMVDDADVVRPVLTEVYRHLELEFDPGSVSSVADERAGTTADEVATSILTAYGLTSPIEPVPQEIDSVTLALAAELQPLHRP